MKQGLGITGLILAILAIFSPYGINFIVAALAILLVSIGALAGERAFAVATSLLSAANLFILSPATLAVMVGSKEGTGILTVVLVFLALPFVAIALNVSGKLAFRR